MIGHKGSSAGLYLTGPTSIHPASIVVTSTLRVKQYLSHNDQNCMNKSVKTLQACIIGVSIQDNSPITESTQCTLLQEQ